MWKKQILFAIFISCLGLLAGMYYPQLKKEFMQEHEAHKDAGALITIPEKGIRSSALAVKLFHVAKDQKDGKDNIFIAPNLIHEVLKELSTLSAGETKKQVDKLIVTGTDGMIPLSCPEAFVLSASDYSLPMPENENKTMRLPFKENKPEAQSLFNSLISDAFQTTGYQLITSENTSEFTRFIVGGASRFQPTWQVPFAASNTILSDFYNADGAIRRVNMMRCRGMIRTAKAEDRSWEAVALFFHPTQEGNTPIAFIGILPTGSMQPFAESLTTETLNDIRTRLAKAEPQDCRVDLPCFSGDTPILSLASLIQKCGLTELFDANKADFSPVSTQKIVPDNIFAQYTLSLTENNKPAGIAMEGAAQHIVFDKPFIWLIGDLTTEAPPFYMGMIQNL